MLLSANIFSISVSRVAFCKISVSQWHSNERHGYSCPQCRGDLTVECSAVSTFLLLLEAQFIGAKKCVFTGRHLHVLRDSICIVREEKLTIVSSNRLLNSCLSNSKLLYGEHLASANLKLRSPVESNFAIKVANELDPSDHPIADTVESESHMKNVQDPHHIGK
ncbi:hypothetical protein AVEN_54632-1 [Araneus ventricosus]|uniref:Uncharacterized protein n=1 Tax=Araneus ventricosus TaxID=182803 RepID=A0A4Y2BP81_ARAVE|nr:hypothetical protein AVEN_54632-1 [Araneus ventricosus]